MISVLISLLAILLFCMVPVLVIRKSLKESLLVAAAIILFFILNINFICGQIITYHDTFWGCGVFAPIMKQWLKEGFVFGWNPFMNCGEPLYLFSNQFFRPIFICFALFSNWIRLDGHIMFNLNLMLFFLNFCVGFLLLGIVLWDDFRVAFVCFISLLLGGCFLNSIGQIAPLIVLDIFPYILLGFFSAIKYNSPYGLVLMLVYLGLAVNHYLPHYIILTFIPLALLIFIFEPAYFRQMIALVRQHRKLMFLGLLLAILAAGPALFLYGEIKDYVAPTRGALMPGVSLPLDEDGGTQPRGTATLGLYDVFVNRYGDVHHSFYIGVLLLLLIPFAFSGRERKKAWAFLALIVWTIWVGLGKKWFLFAFIVNLLPGFNMIRHSFLFAQFINIFALILAGYGMKQLLSGPGRSKTSLFWVLATAIILGSIANRMVSLVFVIISCVVILVCSFLVMVYKDKTQAIRISAGLILIALLCDLLFFNLNYRAKPSQEILPGEIEISEPAVFSYPAQRVFYAKRVSRLPPNLMPLYFKEASVTTANDDYVFFRNKYLHEMLSYFGFLAGYEPALGAEGPLVYLTNRTRVFAPGADNSVMIKEIFSDGIRARRRVYFRGEDVNFRDSAQELGSDVTFMEPKLKKKDDPNKVIFSVNAPADCFLVRLENFHKGWRAFIDGKPVKVYRANFSFQAVRIPQGEHTVTFEFRTIYPVLLYASMLMAVLAWVCLNIYIFQLRN